MEKWLQAIRQTTTYLGVAVIAFIWGGIYLLATQEHQRAYRDAVRQGSNLTRLIEEFVRRVGQQTDSALLSLRRQYEKDPLHFDISRWMARSQAHKELMLQFGIAGGDGFVMQSSHGPLSKPAYVGDRPHFKYQVEDTADELYISAPVIGHVSGKLAIEFTRRLSQPDGAFAGIVAASLDVRQLERFFSSLDLGHGGAVSLVGFDGILRARRARPGLSWLRWRLYRQLAVVSDDSARARQLLEHRRQQQKF